VIRQTTEKLLQSGDLSSLEMARAMEEILTGACVTEEIAAFLVALADKGETIEEITAAARVMRAHAVQIRCHSPIVLDTCGTGGDKKNSFNVSTCAALIIAACGVTIAKHGNRSVSSVCGSADILEALGVNLTLATDKIEKSLNEIGIAFLYAPNFHPAMKFAAPARKQVGRRTIFNILGPLCNPANATHQLIGVYSPGLGPTLAAVCLNLGVCRCLCVHGEGVMDEITTTGATEINESCGGVVKSYSVTPEEFGFPRVTFADLAGGNALENAAVMLELLHGRAGAQRDIVVLNSAAGLYVAGKAPSITAGMALAVEAIDSGRAMEKLEQLKEYSNA
jgi:anthranilate phosphoribosyltransferase